MHTRLQVELHHGQGGARSGAGYGPSESSGAGVRVQPTVTAVLYRFTRRITRYHLVVTMPFITETRSTHCTFKFSDKPLAYIIPNAFKILPLIKKGLALYIRT